MKSSKYKILAVSSAFMLGVTLMMSSRQIECINNAKNFILSLVS